ncbi:uncharacterized protein [Gossypium hirsutum]|uniref:Chromo domain-containing protein n=1 Tax=Gossypium hirsutum TaxID=3635 RepID=A0A1U8HVT5_GOSHI|nr:uncharacterized protein LOC107887713 [Gossypium hirsutum]
MRYRSDSSHVVSIEEIEVRLNLTFENKPIQIVDHDIKILKRKSILLVKVLWQNDSIEEAMWEPEDSMHQYYSHMFSSTNVLDFQQQTLNFQKETKASIRELTISIEKLNSQGKLPSQTEPNPRQHANAMTLQSGKVLEPIPDRNLGQDSAQEKPDNDEQVRVKPPLPKIQPPFPGQLNQCRKGKEDKEILETFKNVEITILLLDAIKQILQHAKFLKELCTNKRKLIGNENVSVGENVSAVLQQKMPAKYKDRGMFAIPCKIGHLGIKKALYRSIVHPEGVLEDVLVKVNELIFTADFYVIKIEDNAPGSSDILLGRPFISTANTKTGVRNGTLTMEFDREIVNFNVYGTISHPSEVLDAPDPKLKPLPEHLKFTFLENDETIADLKEINPLEENMKPRKETQGRLNPNMVDVIKKREFPNPYERTKEFS